MIRILFARVSDIPEAARAFGVVVAYDNLVGLVSAMQRM